MVMERHARFDVTPWSLSFPLIAMAACSIPVVPGSDGDAGTGGETETETETDTDPTGEACEANEECPSGYVCIAGVCEYEYCGGCGGCGVARPDDDQFRCPGYYYDCYSDNDCEENQFCSDGDCIDDPSPDECSALPVYTESIPLPLLEPGAITKLFFASSGNALDDLVGVRDASVLRPTVDGEAVLLTEVAPITDAIAHDANGDGERDFVVATGGEVPAITLWLASAEGYLPVPATPGVDGIAVQLAIGDWNGDGNHDLFTRTADAVYLAYIGEGMIGIPEPLAMAFDRMLLSDVDLSGNTELLLGNGGRFEVLTTTDGVTLEIPDAAPPLVGAVVGDLDGDEIPELLAVRDPFTFHTWRGGLLDAPVPAMTVLDGRALAVTTGQVGSTAALDVVVAREDGFASIYYGGGYDRIAPTLPFACLAEVELPLVATSIAVGDYDQDGDRDLAVTDGTSISVVIQ